MTATYSKNIWRARMFETRSQLGPDKASQFNRDLCKNLLFVFSEGGGISQSSNPTKPLWTSYKSFRWEADPSQAVTESAQFIRWAYPRVVDSNTISFHEPLADALWLKNTWGLWEPDPRTSTEIQLKDCTGVLVPGVAFDRQGHRLGYGKGFYDRVLADFKGLKVGVGFSVQVTDEVLPVEDNDVLMDILVTDTEIIHIREQRH